MAVMGRIFVAKSSFFTSLIGWVHAGDTVREGHPLLGGREELFEVRKNEATFEYEAPKTARQK